MALERVNKRGARYYKPPVRKELPPGAGLVKIAVDTLQAMFPPGGDGPSVTTILSALAKPALISWAAREERKLVSYHASQLYSRLFFIVDEPVTPEQFESLLAEELDRGAHRQLIEKAASVGTQVHNRIEWTLKGELNRVREPEPPNLTTPQAVRAFDRWLEWRAKVNLRVVDIEKRVFSRLFGFGGALDVLAYVNDILVVIDFKTGKAVYDEAFLQNVAYRMALAEEGIDVKGGWIVRLPKYENDPEFDAVPVPDDSSLSSVFVALGVVYRWWEKSHNTKRKKPQPTTISGGLQSTTTDVIMEDK